MGCAIAIVIFSRRCANTRKTDRPTVQSTYIHTVTEETDDDNNDEQVETPQENDVGKEDDDEAFGFFSALASLKE